MKIAILLLAHKNQEQLERLISALRHENIDIFIHLDKKCPFSQEDIQASNVFFVENRFDIGLFEFSMVQAEMELIRTARRHGDYDYFILLSGQCYPLVSVDQLYAQLCSQYPAPLIEIVAPTNTNYVKKNFSHVYILKRFKLKTYAFLKRHFSYKTYRLLRYIPGGIAFLVSAMKELFYGSPKDRLDKMGFPTYCGSQWWILPNQVIERVMKLYENKAFCRTVYDTFSCDETFFQTAIMLEKEANGIETDESGNYMRGQWFFVFDDGHPILLKEEHFQQITSSGKLFARKFDTSIDSHILQLLDDAKR